MLWFSGASLPFDSPPVRSPTAPATPPPPPVAYFACATGIGPGFVMVVIVAAGIISGDMANIGTPAGGDLAPSVTGRYGNRLAGIQLHSSSRGKLVGLFFVFVRRWFTLTSARGYYSRKAFHFTSLLLLLLRTTSSARKVFKSPSLSRLHFTRNYLHLLNFSTSYGLTYVLPEIKYSVLN